MNAVRFVEGGEQLLDYLHQRKQYGGETGSAPRLGLILLDLALPKVDGRKALKIIRGDPALSDIPVVVLLTSSLDQEIARGYQFGVNPFITKPLRSRGCSLR